MNQPKLFYFDILKTWDQATIFFYILVSLVIVGMYDNLDVEGRKNLIFNYTIGTHFFLYLFNYKSLRNLTVYFFWLVVGFIHLYFYFQLKDNTNLFFARGHSATGLRNTLILLLLYQLLRFLSAKTQHQELVSPTRGGGTDLFDDRKVTFVDYTFFVVYVGSALLLYNS